ncbi:hypothetical protein QCE62_06780 [Caballeronia sp. LZ033]|uniref:hypothetical protein n=1 Tax=Caballeronia sp. LZ033 TaxID=3038566 RepID=UPI002856BFD6|nr:hypothetical protein [Caballeronia sp. LZ033]MDR5813295.1 hypothetical protein [Caballeronia sp. LZ033]
MVDQTAKGSVFMLEVENVHVTSAFIEASSPEFEPSISYCAHGKFKHRSVGSRSGGGVSALSRRVPHYRKFHVWEAQPTS